MSAIDYNLDETILAHEGVFAAVMAKVIDYLREVPDLAPVVHMFHEDSGSLEGDLDRALAGTEPLSIMLSIGDAADAAPGVPGVIHLDPVEVVVTIIERPSISRGASGSGLTCNRVCEIAARTLKCARVADAFLHSPQFRVPSIEVGDAVAKSLVFRLTATIS
jgi:hypothetical protein